MTEERKKFIYGLISDLSYHLDCAQTISDQLSATNVYWSEELGWFEVSERIPLTGIRYVKLPRQSVRLRTGPAQAPSKAWSDDPRVLHGK